MEHKTVCFLFHAHISKREACKTAFLIPINYVMNHKIVIEQCCILYLPWSASHIYHLPLFFTPFSALCRVHVTAY